MSNSFRVGEDDIIYAVYSGDQSSETVKEARRKTEDLIKKLREQNKRVLLLGDVRDLGKTDMGTRKEAYDVFTKMDYDRMAFFGAKAFLVGLINLFIKGTRQGSRVRLFRTHEEAKEWLLQ